MARDPKAEVEITANSRGLAAKLREARGAFTRFGSELKKNVFGKDLIDKGFWGKAGAELVGNLGARGASSFGSVMAEQARAMIDYNNALVRLQINGNASAAQIADIDAKIRHASDATGKSRAEIVAAARQYVALTGDIQGASGAIEAWTRVAQASDSSVGDVASTAQALRDNLKIKPEEMEEAFDVLIGQGKQGAVEMSELKSQLATVTPLMAQFAGGTGIKGLRDLGAAVQVVRKGFGGTEETITGVQSLMTALIKNAGRFQKAGVHVMNVDPKTGVKTLKSFREIIDAISDSKLMRDPTKLEKAFGRVEAYRAFLQLRDNKDMLDQLADSTAYAGTTQRDLAKYTEQAGGRLEIAMQKAKNAIADAFTPERIEKFVHLIEELVPKLGKVADFVGDIGDVLGGLEGVGEKLRGVFGGGVNAADALGHNANLDEWLLAAANAKSPHDADRARQMVEGMVGHKMSDTEFANRVATARRDRADEAAFDRTKNEIMGDERDDKSTKQSIWRAVLASYSSNLGEQQAGDLYLKNSGINRDILVRQRLQETGAAIAQNNPQLIRAIEALADAINKQPVNVKVGANTVAQASKEAPLHRSRGG